MAFITGVLNFLPNQLIDPFECGKGGIAAKVRKRAKLSKKEAFNPKIANKFQSVDNLVLYVKLYAKNPDDKLELVNNAAVLLRQRFVHAYSVYGIQENWIAVLAGRFIWRDLAAKVIPDDILKGDAAACSQISIVMMDICNKLEIPTRKVGLVGHYTLEAFIQGKWYFFDLDLKPNFNAIPNGRKSLEEILRNKEEYKLYANTILDSNDIKKKFSNIHYGEINAAPAPRAYFFHVLTKLLSHWLWLTFLFHAFFLKYRAITLQK